MRDPRCTDPLPLDRSREWLARAEGLVPALTQTLAKGPGQFSRGVSPVYAASGRGGRITDVDGTEFVDLTMAVGPLSLGYRHPAVDEAVRAQLDSGMSFSLMHPLEVEVAERIRDMVPGAEAVRFSKTGCDVTTAAVRLARAHTGREKVLCCGYHGWHDWYIGVTDREGGVPAAAKELTHTFRYDDPDHLAASIDDDTACVILEPVVFQEPSPGYLAEVRAICDRAGAVLVFDEMWTGFRLARGGAQEHYGVRADLATFSKAVANGMPLSVLAGRAEVMRHLEHDVFFFTTFGGEALSLAAARATLDVMAAEDVIGRIAAVGRRLREGVNDLAERLDMPWLRCGGLDMRGIVTLAAEDALLRKTLLQQELLRRGVLWSGFHTPCFDHTDADVDHVLAAYADALPVLRDAVAAGAVAERLQGEPLEPVFRRTQNLNTRPVETAR